MLPVEGLLVIWGRVLSLGHDGFDKTYRFRLALLLSFALLVLMCITFLI